ncbi:MAG TPA: RnfH family protein [Usitatibacter sp.]|nr:RnfH family protein [Usitatibacter sp.]
MSIRVSVAIALAARQEVIEIVLPDASRISDALAAPEVRERLRGLDADALDVGIWSRRSPRDAVLREGDRVEIYRPLAADPKDMRRERARLKPSTRSRSAR